MEENRKVVLNEVKDSEFESYLKEAENAINSLDKPLKSILKTFEKKDASNRFFLCDALCGVILNSSKLPSYLLAAIASKYFILGTLPHIVQVQNSVKPEKSSYIG